MLFFSYATAGAAMVAAALYLFRRLRLFVTTSAMLVGALLLIYGPAALSFTLSSGQYGFLVRPLTGNVWVPASMFPAMKARIGDLDPIVASLNFSLALMYAGVILGIEIISRAFPARAAATELAVAGWSGPTVTDEDRGHLVLLIAIFALFLFMLFVSIRENH